MAGPIIQIRGTSGSGKTTLMREFMAAAKCEPHLLHSGTKVRAYRGQWASRTAYVLGDYSPHRSAGGCDTIPTIEDVIVLVDKCRNGLVVFEGLLLSHSWGQMGKWAHEEFGKNYINVFLDTPVEICYQRVVKRRKDRGQETEGDREIKIKKNVYDDYHRVDLCWDRIKNRGGVRIKIPHENPYPALEKIIRRTILKNEI